VCTLEKTKNTLTHTHILHVIYNVIYVSASGPACFDSGILVVVYHIVPGDRFARCHCRKRPSITKRVCRRPMVAARFCIHIVFSHPPPVDVVLHFSVRWAVRINIARARDEYRLKTAAPSRARVCVCAISARSLLCTLLLRLLLYFAVYCRQRVCVYERERERGI